MAYISLKRLFEAGDFKAKSKETGKLVHFKSKDSYQAALKAGTHEDPNAKKGEQPKGAAKSNDMFGGDYAKDRGGEAPKVDSMATVNSIAAKTGMRAQAVAGWADENGVNLSKVSADIDSKKLNPKDFMTAVVGNPGNKYAKDIIAKYSQSASPKSDMGVDSVVYNKRTKTVGIVRMPDERGETKTDADGNVNTDELEPYNPMKYPHQKDAKAAPSTSKEIDSRGLWKPFAQNEPAQPKQARKGNPSVNKEAKKKAEEFGITPQNLGKEGYKKVMYQAAVEALTDANFHDEARELIASIEGKPEWAKKVNYPSMDDPKYKEKMADIRNNGVDSSEYWGSDDNAHEFGRKVAASSGWGGVEAADGIAFTLRMNGFHKEADKIQSIFDNKPYMRESSTKLTSMIKK